MAGGLVYDPTLAVNWRTFQNGDLPNSGVTAATYGDATHVAQVAVNAQGVVTSASNVAISSGGGTVSNITSTGSTITVTNGAGPTANVDLPSSGVAAGTYGSSTQVGQVAVNAQGIVTSASNVSISGIAGTGLVKLFDSTLGAPAASIDTGAAGVEGGHGDLIIMTVTRNNVAGATGTNFVRVNNDSGPNYDNENIQGANVTASAAPALAANQWSIITHGTGGSAGYPGTMVLTIPSYDQTTFNKTGSAQIAILDATAANDISILRAVGWRNTAAITRVAVSDSTGANLLAGSRLVVYGTQ